MKSVPCLRVRHDIVPYRQDVLARRQHRDDNVSVVNGSLGAGDNLYAIPGRGLAQRRYEVETQNVFARLDEIGGHRRAHVAETDEANSRHLRPPSIFEFQF